MKFRAFFALVAITPFSTAQACPMATGPYFSGLDRAHVIVLGTIADISPACLSWCDDDTSNLELVTLNIEETYAGAPEETRTFVKYTVDRTIAWGQNGARFEVREGDRVIMGGFDRNRLEEIESYEVIPFALDNAVDQVMVPLCRPAPFFVAQPEIVDALTEYFIDGNSQNRSLSDYGNQLSIAGHLFF